ncbi:MAG TPA: SigE family RNA polymerase sigma factor [Pseudonocardiaceae bacterium]|nr:SigE family RNA polymerase sigma factor [Pseudonocardiaceae bacterium]
MPITFDDFVAERLDQLLRYATALTCDPHLAKDVVQEVLLRAQQRWRHIETADQPIAYVRRMVLNEYLSWRRRRANRDVMMAHAKLAELSPSVADSTSHYGERQEMLGRIVRLPRRQRAVIVLRYYENLSDAEIAATLGCAEPTVRSHISRALATLRAQDVPAVPSKGGLHHAV